jgi:hypothetical protein
MVRAQTQLTEEQVQAIKKIAMSRHLSVAELLRQAVNTIHSPRGGNYLTKPSNSISYMKQDSFLDNPVV